MKVQFQLSDDKNSGLVLGMVVPAVLQELRLGRARISLGWCRNAFSLDYSGSPVASTKRDAAYFCILGALGYTIGESRPFDTPTVRTLWNQLPHEWKLHRTNQAKDLAEFNDCSTSQADVIALFDRAIQAEELAIAA